MTKHNRRPVDQHKIVAPLTREGIMYTLSRAYFRRQRRNGRWQTFTPVDEKLLTLRSQYGEVWLFVTVSPGDQEYALYLDDLVNLFNDVERSDITVGEWLTQQGNKTLPFRTEFPAFETHYVRYAHAFHAGYTIQPISRLGTVEQGGSAYDKEDLLIQRNDLDPTYVGRRGLFSVNGLFHRTDIGLDGVHVLGGNRSVRIANDNDVGIHSFADIGDIHYISITEDMIHPESPEASLSTAVYIKIPETASFENKTLLLVIGGYLQVLGRTYSRVGERLFRIELRSLSLLERFYQSRELIDLSPLNLTDYDFNPDMISLNEIASDEVVTAYLTLIQSFFVVVDAPSFFQELVALESLGLPGRCVVGQKDYYPLMGAYGIGLEYHYITEDSEVVMAAPRNVRHRFDFETMPWYQYKAVDNGRYPAHPFDDAPIYARLLGVER